MDELDDLELLSKDELIELLRERAEAGVKLSFPGKATARRITRRVRPRVQRTIARYGAGSEEDRAANLLIEGDNLQTLATLYRERGHVDLILTDPPYNTGGDWRYNDKWDEDPNDPGIGELVNADDLARHTKWMKFMYPRLLLMKQMLKPAGVLAICIDHRELFHLGQMLDELFGEQNRLAIINWQKSYSPRSDKDHVSTATEYVLVYAKDEERAKTALMPRSEEMDARYQRRDGDSRAWKSGDLSAGKGPKNQGMVYAIQSPFTGQLHYPPEGNCWRMPRREIKKILEQWGVDYAEQDLKDDARRAKAAGVSPGAIEPRVKGLIVAGDLKRAKSAAKAVLAKGPWPVVYFGVDGNGRPAHKRYLEDVKRGVVPMTFWADDDHEFPEALGSVSWRHEQSGHSQTGVNELTAIVGPDHNFKTVKPLRLFEKLIQIWCPDSGLILDPFAGSGTAGHAALALNETIGTRRRFILIEQGRPEKGDSYAKSLTSERLRRVVTGSWENGKGIALGGGFEFRTLTKQVDATALLAMERDEMVDTVVASYFDSSRRRGPSLVRINDRSYQYLVAHNADGEGFYLVWGGIGENTDLTEDVYEACVAEGEAASLKPIYHIYSRFNLFTTPGVHWYQIPDRILADFGLDVRTEAYNDEED
ncbi:site-specific DNA-methyltransferase [Amycolatopsis azurea]|uniref:site-specific DNA-methyltransferase n=1 Tax=Amycolatopsis azurea TaxID=36819 RepID=UPI0037F7B07D